MDFVEMWSTAGIIEASTLIRFRLCDEMAAYRPES